MENLDKLKVENDTNYIKQLSKDEIVMFSEKVNKINRHGYKQERELILTSMYLYCFNKYRQSRKTYITDIKAAIMNDTSQKDIVLHVPTEFDQRYMMKDRSEFLNMLQLRYANIDKESTFKIYLVKDNLKKYCATLKDRKYGLKNLPPKECRLRDKEIQGAKEMESVEEDYNSEEEKAAEGDIEELDGQDHTNNYREGDLSLENSRTSMKDMSSDLLNTAHDFDPTDLVQRESMLVFASVITPKPLTLEDFQIISVLGKGTFGKVYLTKLKTNDKLYAIKAIRKDILIETDQVEATKLERDILLKCNHEFLLGMDFVFQNDLRLYFVMPFVKGGELYSHFVRNKRFPEEAVKFYAVQIVLAIGYLHEQGIVHRDLKLENILINEDGYLKIIDFGLAKMLKDQEETMTFCGTPEYLAPEVVGHKGHDKAVDWWAVGVLIYEMLIGVTPFYNKNRNLMLSKIQFAKIVFPDK